MYGLGDLKFGQLTYIVLKGILLRDLYPDPDVGSEDVLVSEYPERVVLL